MKKLIIALCILATTSAQAGEIKVKAISQYILYGSASASQEFGYNPDLGRAWVEVSISSNDPDSGIDDLERIKIEGLKFDTQTNTITIDHEGKITTCAEFKLVGRSIFRHKELKMTKDCKFEGRWRKFSYDNGFEIKQTAAYEMFLIVE